MKGLLIKDFRLLSVQKNFLAVILVMCILFLIVYEDPSFMIAYLVMMVSFFSISTISYDEYDNGGAFLFTLPITRKGYVTEKYVFGLINMMLAAVFISVLALLSMYIRHIAFLPEEFVMTLLGSCVAVILILSIMIPLQLKFGAEKSRIALIIMVLAIILAGYLLVNYLIAPADKSQVSQLLLSATNLMDTHPAQTIAGICFVLIVLMLISYFVSVKIMQKKEY